MSVPPSADLSELMKFADKATHHIRTTYEGFRDHPELAHHKRIGDIWLMTEAAGGMNWGIREAPSGGFGFLQGVASAVTNMLKADSRLIVTFLGDHPPYMPTTSDGCVDLTDMADKNNIINYKVSISSVRGAMGKPYATTVLSIEVTNEKQETASTHLIQHLCLPWHKIDCEADGKLIPEHIAQIWVRLAQLVDCINRDTTACSDPQRGAYPTILVEGSPYMAPEMGFLLLFSSLARQESVLLPRQRLMTTPSVANPDLLEEMRKTMGDFATIALEWAKTMPRVPIQAYPTTASQLLAFYLILQHMQKTPLELRPMQGLPGNVGYRRVKFS